MKTDGFAWRSAALLLAAAILLAQGAALAAEANDPTAGMLDVSIINGFKPAYKNSFDILDFTAADGMFDTVNLPGTATDWDLAELYTTGVICYIRQGSSVLMIR